MATARPGIESARRTAAIESVAAATRAAGACACAAFVVMKHTTVRATMAARRRAALFIVMGSGRGGTKAHASTFDGKTILAAMAKAAQGVRVRIA